MMIGLKYSNNTIPLLTMLFFLVFYLSFPTLNSTIDAYTYGYSIKWGEELFSPHHLLYNYLLHQILITFVKAGLADDALFFAKACNALFATGILFVCWEFARFLNKNVMTQFVVLLFIGSSFAMMRFATENEAYLLPVLISLTGLYFLLKFSVQGQTINLIICSFFSAFACLFHQIHFFWWISVLIYLLFSQASTGLKIKYFVWYGSIGSMVPLIYTAVLYHVNGQLPDINEFLTFVFHDFHQGNVETNFGFKNIALSLINLVRTFFQLHGKIWYLIGKYPMLIFVAVLVFLLLYNAFIPVKNILPKLPLSHIPKLILLIIMLQFLFALYAVGNAEFMVMIPPLAGILLLYSSLKTSSLFFLSFAMFVWNAGLSVIPDALIDYDNHNHTLGLLKQQKEKQYLLSHAVLINNIYYYHYHEYPENLHPTNNKELEDITPLIESKLKKGIPFLTDMTNTLEPMSRSRLLESEERKNYLKKFILLEADSMVTFYGIKKLYRIKELKQQY